MLENLGGLGFLPHTMVTDELFYSLVLKAVQMFADRFGAGDQCYCSAVLAHVFRIIAPA